MFSDMITVLCPLFWMFDFSPAISTSAFLTAITIGVCAVAVSKFSIYLNRFLWFSTLKFTPAIMSKKSIAFVSFVIIGISISASESSSSELPIFFLFFYLLLRGSLLHAASCAAPKINVNFFLRSSASSRKLSSCFLRLSSVGFVVNNGSLVLICYLSACISFSSASILLFYLAVVVLWSNSIFCYICCRYSLFSCFCWVPFLGRAIVFCDSPDCYYALIVAISASSFLVASSDCVSL
jgi:hypothetical protein